ncbi:MAG: PDZ domain-containing protein [Chloroflexi bacterium]|nr:PDZ domain-containing protein [Chloroflexota bacterium]
MTRWRLIKLVLAISAIAIVGLSVAAGVAASRNSDSNGSNDVVLQGDKSGGTSWLGIQARTSHDPVGVAITAVVDGSPAADADLELDDVIVAVDGDHTKNPGALKRALHEHSPGDEVTLSVVKAGAIDPTDVTIILIERPDAHELFEGLKGSLRHRLEGLKDSLHHSLGERFDHFLDLNLRFLDDDGNVVEFEAVSGTVVTVSDNEVTIETADGDEQTFALTDDTHVPNDLAEGDRVVVISVDGTVKAVTGPGLGIFKHLPLPDFDFDFDLELPELTPFEGCEPHTDIESWCKTMCRSHGGPPGYDYWFCDGHSDSFPFHGPSFPLCRDGGAFHFGPWPGLFNEDDVREEIEEFCEAHEGDMSPTP